MFLMRKISQKTSFHKKYYNLKTFYYQVKFTNLEASQKVKIKSRIQILYQRLVRRYPLYHIVDYLQRVDSEQLQTERCK